MTYGLGWFDDKICKCDRFGYRAGDYETLHEFTIIPTCANCGKWADRVQVCCKCREHFYQYFSHPRMGYRTGGWYCWDCLERYSPAITYDSRNRGPGYITYGKNPPHRRIPPPDAVLVPFRELSNVSFNKQRVNKFSNL